MGVCSYMGLDFTICSSYYSPQSKALLELNCDVVSAKNPGVSLPWIVADNTPPSFLGEKLNDARFVLVPGARQLEREHIEVYHKGKTPSCEHGVVLNNFHTYAKTRFVLIVDNDFFIIQKNWIERVLRHMDENNITFFGSPFHPRYYHKLRYFPCPQLFFIDTKNIPMSSLNFMPRCDFSRDKKHVVPQVSRHSTELTISKFVRRLGRMILGSPDKYNYHYNPFSPRERGMIEGSLDTVTYILREYRDHPNIRSECLQSVFKPSVDGGRGGVINSLNRVTEAFLPDSLCFIPKRKNYFTTRGFKDRGYFDVQGIDKWWEESVWKDEPFGFHLRQHRSATDRTPDADLAYVKKAVASF